METQKIVNLLNDSIMNSQSLQQENGMLLMTKTVETMVKVPPLSLKQKLINHFCVITQMPMCL